MRTGNFLLYFIKESSSYVCRKSLCNVFMLTSETYDFNMERHHGDNLPYLALSSNYSHFPFNSGVVFAMAFDNDVFHRTLIFVISEMIFDWSKSSLISSLQPFGGLPLGTLPVTFIH